MNKANNNRNMPSSVGGASPSKKAFFSERGNQLPIRDMIYSANNSYHGPSEEYEFDLVDLVKVIFARKFMILAFLTFGAASGLILGLQQIPLFSATTTIEVQKQRSQIVDGSGVDPITVADKEFMQTQYALLKSRSLSERVVLLLGLEKDPRFADQASNRNERIRLASVVLLENLKIEPVGTSRVIGVTYIDPNPSIAAKVPNVLVNSYIESTLERKFNRTAYARDFLKERLAQSKANLEEAERRLVEYAEKKNILELDQSGDSSSLVSTNLVRLNEEYSIAQSKRINLGQIYKEYESGEVTSEMLENQELARLRAAKSKLRLEYQELLFVLKPDHPEALNLASRIETIDDEIAQLKAEFKQAAYYSHQAALAREEMLKQKLDSSASELRDLRSRRIDYTILQREVDTARSQYDALLQRLKEVSMVSEVGSSQISVVDSAVVPKFPFSPFFPLYLGVGMLMGLVVGSTLALVMHVLDDTIQTPDDVKLKLHMPAIGVIPVIKSKNDNDKLIVNELKNPLSGVSEAYFSARTALEFSTDAGVPRSLLITSTQPAEGKSSSALALAISFAKVGRKVLIIDADLRKPSFVADTDSSHGLSGILTKQHKLEDNIIFSEAFGVHLLPSGVIPPNPAELLSSPRLKAIIANAEELFDIVIVDSPPILNFTDGPVLGAACQAALIVYRSGSIRTPAALRTVERLRDNNVNVIGAVLTYFDAKKVGYDYNYYYYAYGDGATEYVEKDKVAIKASSRRKIHLFQSDFGE